MHIKEKLYEANKCSFRIRSLLKEGYTQGKIDRLFNAIVLSKILYGLPVYAASASDGKVFLPDVIRGATHQSVIIF